jgi:hypothetical protein
MLVILLIFLNRSEFILISGQICEYVYLLLRFLVCMWVDNLIKASEMMIRGLSDYDQ